MAVGTGTQALLRRRRGSSAARCGGHARMASCVAPCLPASCSHPTSCSHPCPPLPCPAPSGAPPAPPHPTPPHPPHTGVPWVRHGCCGGPAGVAVQPLPPGRRRVTRGGGRADRVPRGCSFQLGAGAFRLRVVLVLWCCLLSQLRHRRGREGRPCPLQQAPARRSGADLWAEPPLPCPAGTGLVLLVLTALGWRLPLCVHMPLQAVLVFVWVSPACPACPRTASAGWRLRGSRTWQVHKLHDGFRFCGRMVVPQ